MNAFRIVNACTAINERGILSHASTFFLLLLLESFLSAAPASAQQIRLSRFYEQRSSYILSHSFTPVRKEAIDSICKAFGVYKKQKSSGDEHYLFRAGNSRFQFTVLDANLVLKDSVTLMHHEGKRHYHAGDSLHLFGFTVLTPEGKRMSKRYSRLLLSAYLQETDTGYANADTFLTLPPKSTGEFWRRNFINMGYGMSYAGRQNPFISGTGFAAGFGYVWEAGHYIPIFGGPFFGATTADKIIIPVAGLSSLLIWKTVFYGALMGQPKVKGYNKMAKMKYKVPKNVVR